MHATHEQDLPPHPLAPQGQSPSKEAYGLDQLPGPIFGLDRYGLISIWNQAMARLTRTSPETMIGTSLPSLVRALPDFKLEAPGPKEDDPQPTEVTFIDGAGAEHRLRCAFRAERDNQGFLTRVLAMGVPSPAAVPAAQYQRVSVAETNEFLSNILHSVNNALTVINGNLNLIEMNRLIGLEPELRQLVQDARLAAEQQAQLLAALQQVARVAWGPQGCCDVGEALETIALVFSRSLPEGIELTTSGAVGCQIGAGSGELYGALQHLVRNAVEASEENGRIHLGCQPGTERPDQVEVTVRDTGSGIDPQFMDRLTDPAFTTKRGVGGAGLGLALVDLFARSVGGTLALESIPGEGTLARMRLPLTSGSDQS